MSLVFNVNPYLGSLADTPLRSDAILVLFDTKFGFITVDMTNEPSIVNILKNPAERRGWIIWQLRNRGWSLRRIALREGVSVQAVSSALMVSSSHLQSVIADLLEMTPQQLFPEFFDAAGRRLGRTRDPQRTTRAAARNVEEGKVA